MDKNNDKQIEIKYKDKKLPANNLIDFIINFLVDSTLSDGDFYNEKYASSNKGGCNQRHDK